MHQPQNVAKVLNSISPVHITYKNALGMILCKLKLNKIAARWPAKAVAQFFCSFKNRQ